MKKFLERDKTRFLSSVSLNMCALDFLKNDFIMSLSATTSNCGKDVAKSKKFVKLIFYLISTYF